jgi:DNA modification methylase
MPEMSQSSPPDMHLKGATRRLSIQYCEVKDLKPDPKNSRVHSKKQVRQIAKSIEAFGFNVPVLIDQNRQVIAGHGRIEACSLLGIGKVPTIALEGMTEAQIRAFMIADNRLTENATWDEKLLGEQLKTLSEIDLDFELEATGFETTEIDLLIEGIASTAVASDPADQVPEVDTQVQVTREGDLWLLDGHRVLCGNALQLESYSTLLNGKYADCVFSDPPYNVPIAGHASGLGKVQHEDFVMASGEMSESEFIAFLTHALELSAQHSKEGSLQFICMDWRHSQELLAAGKQVYSELKNLCVWVKDNAGMGSLYRSQHELVFVFKHGEGPHRNNVQLGQHGRYRTNVWHYPGANSFSRSGEEGNLLAVHPTVKPAALVADAILDCTRRGEIVLDPFLGSGTTVIAAQRTGRLCFGLELHPPYVDAIVRRWQKFTGNNAVHSQSGRAFDELEQERTNG